MTKEEIGQREFIPVDGTPFNIVKEDGKCRIVMGNYLVSEKVFISPEKTKDYIKQKPWELMIPAFGILAEKVYEDMLTKTKKDEK